MALHLTYKSLTNKSLVRSCNNTYSLIHIDMTINRTTFFVAIFTITVFPLIGYKLLWIFTSTKTFGEVRFTTKDYSGQLVSEYSVTKFLVGKNAIWFHSLDNQLFIKGQIIPVRYQENDPSNARVNTFAGLWADTLIIISPLFLIVLIAYLHPELVPRTSKIRLGVRRPFIRIV